MPKHLRLKAGVAVLLALPAFASCDVIKRANQPAMSPDGATVLFEWQGDIWKVPREGGRALRLTVHPARDFMPLWSPDGKKIVFSSDRYGNYDVFSMDTDGNDVRRLTFDSGIDYPMTVSPDGKYVYGATSYFAGRSLDLFRIPIAGGEPVRLTDHPFEHEYYPSISPDGKSILFNRGSYGPLAWQKPAVTGRAMPDIWVADNTVPLSNQRPLVNSDDSEMFPLLSTNGSLFYVSNKGGWPNLWRSNEDGSGAKQLTHHRDGTMRYPSISADGSYAVYDFESQLYVLNTKTGDVKPLEIDVPADQRTNPVQEFDLTSGLSDYAIAPDSKRAVIALRGDLFLIPEKGGTTRRLTTNTGLDYDPVFLDPKTILYVRSNSGKRELYTVDLDGNSKPFLVDAQDVFHPLLSPDGKTLLVQRGADEIAITPASGGAMKTVMKGDFISAYRGAPVCSWSPDSKWIVVDRETSRGSSTLLMVRLEDGKAVEIGKTPWGASTPRFLPNGKGVYFLAQLGYSDPYPQLFVIDLVQPEVTFSEDDLDKLDEPKNQKPSTVIVEVQESGIEHRMRQLTRGGAFSAQATPDGKAIWVSTPDGMLTVPVLQGATRPGPDLGRTPVGLSLGPGNQKLYFASGGKFFSFALDRGAVAPINFEANFTANLRAEEHALFDEIWWAMDRLYYDKGFHGVDWIAMKAKFEKLVPYVTDRSDFYQLMIEMMEELNSSHLGTAAPPTENFGNDNTGLLGVDFDSKALDARGVYNVTRVLTGSPADNPESKLEVGDRILRVNGAELGSGKPLSELLNRAAGKKVELRVLRGDKEVTVDIKPMPFGALSGLEYENWVDWERAQVDKLSNGQLAYFHIRAMSDPEYDQFLTEVRTLTAGKKGAIIDVRYNGGGSTAHKVLAILIKTPWLIRTTRGPEGLRVSENILRGESLELPSALLFNSYSFSNAEIMGEGFRQLKLGPTIGERTPGYVIGTGGMTLWDGGFIRLPSIGVYAINGEELENNGRRPDFSVPFDPNAWNNGRDPQLEKAVQEVMKRIGG